MVETEANFLNSREVARLLDVSPDQVNEYARKQILPAFKAGRQWRFRKQDVASFKRQFQGANAA
jgi:excisionase family DNA binding protein